MSKLIMDEDFLQKCAQNIADTMMAHYWNHNVVTDGYESGAEEDGFSHDEIEDARDIDLTDPEFKQLVIAAVSEAIENAS